MTPKEKAEELISKFTEHTKVFHENLGWVDYHDSAKECALIAVDLVLYSFPSYPSEVDGKLPDSRIDELMSAENYWIEVKAEIEKL